MISKLTFDEWKLRLRQDCDRQRKLLVLDGMGDFVLERLWQSGLEPTIAAISGRASERRTAVWRNDLLDS